MLSCSQIPYQLTMSTYRSLAIFSPNQELQLQTRDLEAAVSALPPDGVLVRVFAAGVCHSDVHLWRGGLRVGKGQMVRYADRPGMGYPIVPGHEVAGSVYAVGVRTKVETKVFIGERVVVYPWIGCDECYLCEAGDVHLCFNSREIGFCADGGYAEFVYVPHNKYVFKLPDHIPDDVAAILPCSALTAYTAVQQCLPALERIRRWNVEVLIAVIGLGGLGQWALRFIPKCINVDKLKVVGIDINAQKLESALQENHVTDAFLFHESEPPSQQSTNLLDLFGGRKLHIVFDFVNTPETFVLAHDSLHKGGMVLPIGLHGGLGEITLPFTALNVLTIAGSYTGSLSNMQDLLAFMQDNPTPPPTITSYRLDEATSVLKELEKGTIVGRAVLKMD